MIIAIFAIVIGFVLGWYLPFIMWGTWSLYIAVGVLAAIDSVFGAIRASMENKFDHIIFISGFLVNSILAGFLAYIGDTIGIPLYYAAVFAFGVRLFQNLARIRRIVIEEIREKKYKKR